ncbi:MAG: hypothetical protein RIR97_2018, partial [Pseudomonadota bacterium]
DDTLTGGDGNDHLKGGAGADVLSGGAGTDMADYSTSGSGVTLDLLQGTGTGGEAQGDSLSGIENITGSNYDDVLTGDGNVNALYGGSGNDTLNGGGGADFLSGGDGNDLFMSAGHGTETVSGGAGLDTIRFSGSGNIVLTGISDVEIFDFRNSGSNSAEITSSFLTSLAPENHILTINRDADDVIALTGATDTHSQISNSGLTYDVYTMLDDQNHQIQVHIQAA